jgi:hypothetical protein
LIVRIDFLPNWTETTTKLDLFGKSSNAFLRDSEDDSACRRQNRSSYLLPDRSCSCGRISSVLVG